ncbi:hypothetical protein PPERSA_11762 [Pseudocohnilembus persalinus]|uniref:Uncharacterized protein n=1 Tax=Pseudocohnilembus persalinus TaxID=266149 RepID=A0A0V0QGC1_PSEPJ|nr:hypothetical protein PPERSA_11762 [Pseudocohnilembus persalinus]|eukprot:KRX01315.1 hypothetical protein PPERSA_11762 [Pseudocohnilembus persalinus]
MPNQNSTANLYLSSINGDIQQQRRGTRLSISVQHVQKQQKLNLKSYDKHSILEFQQLIPEFKDLSYKKFDSQVFQLIQDFWYFHVFEGYISHISAQDLQNLLEEKQIDISFLFADNQTVQKQNKEQLMILKNKDILFKLLAQNDNLKKILYQIKNYQQLDSGQLSLSKMKKIYGQVQISNFYDHFTNKSQKYQILFINDPKKNEQLIQNFKLKPENIQKRVKKLDIIQQHEQKEDNDNDKNNISTSNQNSDDANSVNSNIENYQNNQTQNKTSNYSTIENSPKKQSEETIIIYQNLNIQENTDFSIFLDILKQLQWLEIHGSELEFEDDNQEQNKEINDIDKEKDQNSNNLDQNKIEEEQNRIRLKAKKEEEIKKAQNTQLINFDLKENLQYFQIIAIRSFFIPLENYKEEIKHLRIKNSEIICYILTQIIERIITTSIIENHQYDLLDKILKTEIFPNKNQYKAILLDLFMFNSENNLWVRFSFENQEEIMIQIYNYINENFSREIIEALESFNNQGSTTNQVHLIEQYFPNFSKLKTREILYIVQNLCFELLDKEQVQEAINLLFKNKLEEIGLIFSHIYEQYVDPQFLKFSVSFIYSSRFITTHIIKSQQINGNYQFKYIFAKLSKKQRSNFKILLREDTQQCILFLQNYVKKQDFSKIEIQNYKKNYITYLNQHHFNSEIQELFKFFVSVGCHKLLVQLVIFNQQNAILDDQFKFEYQNLNTVKSLEIISWDAQIIINLILLQNDQNFRKQLFNFILQQFKQSPKHKPLPDKILANFSKSLIFVSFIIPSITNSGRRRNEGSEKKTGEIDLNFFQTIITHYLSHYNNEEQNQQMFNYRFLYQYFQEFLVISQNLIKGYEQQIEQKQEEEDVQEDQLLLQIENVYSHLLNLFYKSIEFQQFVAQKKQFELKIDQWFYFQNKQRNVYLGTKEYFKVYLNHFQKWTNNLEPIIQTLYQNKQQQQFLQNYSDQKVEQKENITENFHQTQLNDEQIQKLKVFLNNKNLEKFIQELKDQEIKQNLSQIFQQFQEETKEYKSLMLNNLKYLVSKKDQIEINYIFQYSDFITQNLFSNSKENDILKKFTQQEGQEIKKQHENYEYDENDNYNNYNEENQSDFDQNSFYKPVPKKELNLNEIYENHVKLLQEQFIVDQFKDLQRDMYQQFQTHILVNTKISEKIVFQMEIDQESFKMTPLNLKKAIFQQIYEGNLLKEQKFLENIEYVLTNIANENCYTFDQKYYVNDFPIYSSNYDCKKCNQSIEFNENNDDFILKNNKQVNYDQEIQKICSNCQKYYQQKQYISHNNCLTFQKFGLQTNQNGFKEELVCQNCKIQRLKYFYNNLNNLLNEEIHVDTINHFNKVQQKYKHHEKINVLPVEFYEFPKEILREQSKFKLVYLEEDDYEQKTAFQAQKQNMIQFIEQYEKMVVLKLSNEEIPQINQELYFTVLQDEIKTKRAKKQSSINNNIYDDKIENYESINENIEITYSKIIFSQQSYTFYQYFLFRKTMNDFLFQLLYKDQQNLNFNIKFNLKSVWEHLFTPSLLKMKKIKNKENINYMSFLQKLLEASAFKLLIYTIITRNIKEINQQINIFTNIYIQFEYKEEKGLSLLKDKQQSVLDKYISYYIPQYHLNLSTLYIIFPINIKQPNKIQYGQENSKQIDQNFNILSSQNHLLNKIFTQEGISQIFSANPNTVFDKDVSHKISKFINESQKYLSQFMIDNNSSINQPENIKAIQNFINFQDKRINYLGFLNEGEVKYQKINRQIKKWIRIQKKQQEKMIQLKLLEKNQIEEVHLKLNDFYSELADLKALTNPLQKFNKINEAFERLQQQIPNLIDLSQIDHLYKKWCL